MCTERCERRRTLVLTMSSEMLETRVDDIDQSYEVRSWISSPLGHNMLLAMFKDTKGSFDYFIKQYVNLKNKPEFTMSTKKLLAPDSSLMHYLKSVEDVEVVESPRNAAIKWNWSSACGARYNSHFEITCNREIINSGVETETANKAKQFIDLKKSGMEHKIPGSAQLVLLNANSFTSPWAKNNGNSLMKIYNSFSYTQDVHYEARILELPLRDSDFKLVVIAPNDVDLLHTLFSRLAHDGLKAAICNIQPIFTTQSKLIAPVIQFHSEETFDLNIGQLGAVTVSQFGTTNVSEMGVKFSVLSYLCVRWYPKKEAKNEGYSTKNQPFFFGLVFQDTPIFTGQFNYE